MLRLPSFLHLRPRRRIVLHIGLPKCGSSSIQAHMADHAAAHRARGVCYPETGRDKAGYRNHLPLARMAPQDLDAAVDAIRDEAEGCHTLVLSCEHWTNAFPHCNLAALCDALAERMPEWDLRITAWFRNPVDFVESCYAQYVLAGLFQISRHTFYSGAKPSIEKFLTEFEARRGFPLYSNLSFAQMLQEGLAGRTLTFRSIEAADLKPGGMLADFCALARLPAPKDAPRANARVSNRKLAELEYVQTLVDQNTYGALRERLLAAAFPRLPEADNRRVTSLHIGPDLAGIITDRTRSESAAIARLFDTRTTALCTMPTRNWARHDMLGERDRKILAAFIAAKSA